MRDAPGPEGMPRWPWHMLVRDALLLGVCLALLAASHAMQDAARDGWVPLAWLAGLLLPLCGYLVHEWGHLLGCVLGRSVVHLPPTPMALLLFRFDTGRNSRRQFLLMFWGGFVASVAIVALYASVLDARYLADRIALWLTALGVLATFVLEIPEGWRVYRGAALPRGRAFVNEGAGT